MKKYRRKEREKDVENNRMWRKEQMPKKYFLSPLQQLQTYLVTFSPFPLNNVVSFFPYTDLFNWWIQKSLVHFSIKKSIKDFLSFIKAIVPFLIKQVNLIFSTSSVIFKSFLLLWAFLHPSTFVYIIISLPLSYIKLIVHESFLSEHP